MRSRTDDSNRTRWPWERRPALIPAESLGVGQRRNRGILWSNASLTAHGTGHVNSPGVLRAYDANDISRELWNSNLDAPHDACGRISKNAPPTVVNGKVYLASFGALPVATGALYVYGLLPKTPAAP